MTRIIRAAYGSRYNLSPRSNDRGLSFAERVEVLFQGGFESLISFLRGRWIVLTATGLLVLLLAGTLYCYNLLVYAEQDVLAANGKVATLLQRRNDISINLSKATLDYSRHERDVFTSIVTLRSLMGKKGAAAKAGEGSTPVKGAAPSPSADTAGGLKEALSGNSGGTDYLGRLGGFTAVAEQYPDLKLSGTFLSLMAALVEVEKDLAAQRITYNDKVNIYTTYLSQFPVNIFGALFGFEKKPYFTATDDAQALTPINY